MKTFPIYWNKSQTEKITTLLEGKSTQIKAGHQGSGVTEVLGENILKEIQEIHPKITFVSINYYSCEGKADNMIVAAIKVGNNFTEENKIEGNIYKGFKMICSDYTTGGHLSKYYLLRGSPETTEAERNEAYETALTNFNSLPEKIKTDLLALTIEKCGSNNKKKLAISKYVQEHREEILPVMGEPKNVRQILDCIHFNHKYFSI